MTEPAAYQQAPVCPRHPDRVSYVSCQRCGRPVCPECQRPAAVGVQCVDCVRESARTTRMPRTQLGGRVSDGRPLVTMTIIGACVAVWLLQQVIPAVTGSYAFEPAYGKAEPYRFITAAFLHGPIFHIAFNMYALWIVGSYLEPLLGRLRFAALYVVCAIGGSVGSLLLATPSLDGRASWVTASVGASGAVFGLFGALLVLNRHLGRPTGGIWAVVLINGVIGFTVQGIAWQAHLGGFITGLLCAVILVATSGKALRRLQLPALAAVLVLLVLATVVKYAGVSPQFLA
ncbi:rhomboid family intramembrane serine protease [Oryzihumus sp.]|jgi:membrane associated rhomboid family serine protease|uniref:rhomboid family intramembrane serine protease n=1 Tax=Oryzihumus sp. TaxID=1968903 RepID=UPI002EDAA759